MNPLPPALRAALERAQRTGMLGPEAVERQVAHALEFLRPFELAPDAECIDLGSGGGVPGLPLALTYVNTRWTLVDAWEARCAHLERSVRELGLEPRVGVVHGRAEELGQGALRARADIVVARSFGPPPLTVESGGPMLKQAGLLVLSVTGGNDLPEELAALGLRRYRAWSVAAGSFVAYRREAEPEPRFPRRPAAQRRSPLF